MSFSIGRKLKQLRIERNIKTDQISQLLNISNQSYCSIENGLKDLSYTTLKEISKILNIDTKEITDVYKRKTLEEQFIEVIGSKLEGDSLNKIEEILRYYSAHERLYTRMKEK